MKKLTLLLTTVLLTLTLFSISIASAAPPTPDPRDTAKNKRIPLTTSWTKIIDAGDTLRWGYIAESNKNASCITDNNLDYGYGKPIIGLDSLQYTNADKALYCRAASKRGKTTLVIEVK